MRLSVARGDVFLLAIPPEVVVGILYACVCSWFLHRRDRPSSCRGRSAIVLPFERHEHGLKDAA